MDNCEFVHVKTELEIKEENKVQRREIQKQENEEKRAHTYIVRTWTDNTGKFSVDAEFNGMSFGKVQLKKNDGKIIKIDLEKLSDEDREWIKTEK